MMRVEIMMVVVVVVFGEEELVSSSSPSSCFVWMVKSIGVREGTSGTLAQNTFGLIGS